MNTSTMMNALITQRHGYYTNIPINTSSILNVITTQLGTSCSFDSPGLARNEPTPGKRSQGDSTPQVLSFFYEDTLTMKPFMADCTQKAQHLRRCFPQNIYEPRVACTIVWQPWAIKSTTPTALKRSFYILVYVFSRLNSWRFALRKRNTYGVDMCISQCVLYRNIM